MRKTILFLFLSIFISQLSFSQIGLSASEKGKLDKFKKGVLEKFKNSKTIFVLTEAFNKDSLNDILDKYWTVTPYEMVSYKDFDKYNYTNGNYSFAVTQGYKSTVVKTVNGIPKNDGTTYLHTFMSIRMYDFDKIRKKIKPKHNEWYINAYERKYTQYISRMEFFPNSEFIRYSLNDSTSTNDAYELMMSKNVFHNNTLGHFKNNIQKLNNLLIDGEEYWMFEDDYLPELKNLSLNKLYVPEYAIRKYNPFDGTENKEKNYGRDIFNDYDFTYEIIDSSELDKKILNNEEIYYLRYVRANASKFIHVVNAKTGEVVYRHFVSGLMAYNLKNKHINKLNSKINKAMKK